MIGAPSDTNHEKLLDIFKQNDIPIPSYWSKVISKDAYGLNCKYI